MTHHRTFKLTIVATAIMAAYGPACADETDDMVRLFSKPDSYLNIGIANLAGHREQLGRYDGLNDNGAYGMLDLSVRKRDDATGVWTNFSGRNLGLDSREFRAEYEKQGRWGAALDYSETTSRDPKSYITGTTGIGGNRLQYGAVPATAAAAQSSLFPATNEVRLGTKRKNTTLSGVTELMPDLSLTLSFKNEDKKGTQLWGRGINPEFAVQPIDWNIQQFDAALNYAGKQLQLQGGISASWFRNDNSFVDTLGGSQTSAAGAAFNGGHVFLSVPLDNEALQAFVNGGYNFSAATRGSFKLSFARAKQNDDLSAISNAIRATGATGSSGVDPVAPSRLGGKVDTTTVNLALSSKPIDKLSVVAKFDYNERKDLTPVQVFSTTAIAGGQTNNPHSFTKQSGMLEGVYRLPDGYSAVAAVERERRQQQLDLGNDGAFEGTVKMRNTTDESTLRLQLRRSMSATLNGSLALLHGKRKGSSWNQPATEVIAIANQAGVPYTDASPATVAFTNPFAYADRTRDAWRAAVDWTPSENVSLQFNLQQSNDDYDPAKSGLQSGRGQLVSLDAGVALTKDWQLTGWASQDTNKAHQIGITYDPRTTAATGLRDAAGNLLTTLPGSVGWLCSSANTGAGQCNFDLVWDATLKDTNNNIGIGLKGKATPKLNLGANLQWSEAKSQYPISSNVPSYNTGTNAAPTNRSRQGLPDITTTTVKLGVFGQYAVQKNMDARVDLIHQRWKTNDWQWMTWNSTGTALQPFTYMDGTRIVQRQEQMSNFVGVSLSYKFQ
jgi:MtrB/PioB family decaheme-associated outer membrane protein